LLMEITCFVITVTCCHWNVWGLELRSMTKLKSIMNVFTLSNYAGWLTVTTSPTKPTQSFYNTYVIVICLEA
jgi:hypothetical protein